MAKGETFSDVDCRKIMALPDERVDAEKKLASASKELKQREQSLFLEGLRKDSEAEQAVAALTESANLTAEITRMFAITIHGGNVNG